MAGGSEWNRKRWTEEDEERARISRNRDFGEPFDYDEASRTCEGEEVCRDESWMRRPEEEGHGRMRYPRVFDPARMQLEESRHRFEAAKGDIGSQSGYRYEPSHSHEEARRETYRGMGQFMRLWMKGGRYSGIGPKGYRRSDARITEDVCDVLTQHGWVDASDIEVRVIAGEVNLSGSVPERSMKREAEDAAMSVSGVRDVHNQLSIAEANRTRATREQHAQRAGSPESSSNFFGTEARPMTPTTQESTATQSGPPAASTPSTGAATQKPRFEEGMDVVDAKGNFIGRIKSVRQSDFLVDRSMARDLYVPNSSIKTVQDHVVLNVDEKQLESMDLPKPDIFS